MDKNIIIIGAGASGVAAATKLISNGFNHVTILEAESRIGGRVNTMSFGANVVDLGAESFVCNKILILVILLSWTILLVLGAWVKKETLYLN